MKQITAILFDMDGVLIDSEAFICQSAVDFFKARSVDVDRSLFPQYTGTGENAFIYGLAKTYGVPIDDIDAAKKEMYDIYNRLVEGKLGAMPGVLTLLQNAKQAGVKIAVATSADRTKMEINLRLMNIEPSFFDALINGSMLERKKPFPDIYQLAAITLGVSPDTCLVFEDALTGIHAAKTAGSLCFAVTTSFSVPELEQAGADAVLSGLAAFPQFSTLGEFNTAIQSLMGADDGREVYGANKITPGKSPYGEEQLLKTAIKLATEVRNNAYVPYSGYKVGAAVVSATTGRIYTGCNVENSSYGATICAERNAALSAVAHEGSIGIDLVVVVSDDDPPAPPCAQCLQVLAEFIKEDAMVVLCSLAGSKTQYTFKDLLPHPFLLPSVRS